MTATDILMANRFIRDPVGDSKCGTEVPVDDNGDKARTFVKMFFPLALQLLEDQGQQE